MKARSSAGVLKPLACAGLPLLHRRRPEQENAEPTRMPNKTIQSIPKYMQRDRCVLLQIVVSGEVASGSPLASRIFGFSPAPVLAPDGTAVAAASTA